MGRNTFRRGAKAGVRNQAGTSRSTEQNQLSAQQPAGPSERLAQAAGTSSASSATA